MIFKMTILGDGAVGKTSLRQRYMGRGFTPQHQMTIGADFAAVQKDVSWNDKTRPVTFQIWDVAGQKRFTEVRARFYFGSLGGLMVFDLTRPESFQNAASWINEIWKNNGKGVVPIVLIGNKSDLRDKNSVPKDKILEYCKALTDRTIEHGFTVEYVETSAKTGENIDTAFEILGRKIFDAHQKRTS